MPAPKPEAKEAPPAGDKSAPAAPEKDKSQTPAPEKSAAAAAPSRPGSAAAVGSIVLAPALSWAVCQFVLLPKLQKAIAAPLPAASADAAAGGDAAPKDGKEKNAPPTYEFTNVVVNLAGTMGTRLLRTSFIVTGPAADLHTVFDSNKAKMTDVTLNVLSSLTLSDLEEPGSRNVLREKLVAAYNQSLGRKVADQIYFSDFVVQ